MIFFRYLFLCWVIVLSLTFAGSAQNRDIASAGKIRNAETAREASVKLWKQSFDMVWESVKLFCFDENVCGKNWDDLKQKYEPRVALVKNDSELHILLQTMLNELNTSHMRIIPIAPEDVLQRHHWGIGAETEIIDSRLTIKKVYPDSPAEKANLRPGFVITKINDRSVEQIIDEYKNNPLWAGKNWRNTVRDLIYVYYLAGTENAAVSIEFLDEKDTFRRAALVRSFKNRLPKEVEYKMLEGGAGYIKLNVFSPSAMPDFCKAVRSMNEAPAIILDLRDNPGGTTKMSESVL